MKRIKTFLFLAARRYEYPCEDSPDPEDSTKKNPTRVTGGLPCQLVNRQHLRVRRLPQLPGLLLHPEGLLAQAGT